MLLLRVSKGELPETTKPDHNSLSHRWGVEIPTYLTGITVVNKAVSGRSARSYWREGKWAAVQASLVSGDCKYGIVIVYSPAYYL